MRRCSQCNGSLEAEFRFCPWCGVPQRSKLVEFFHAHALVPGDRGKALRVTRYAGPTDEERHVRFSVWNDEGRAEGAVSLDDAEAERVASFVLVSLGRAARPLRRRLVDAVGLKAR